MNYPMLTNHLMRFWLAALSLAALLACACASPKKEATGWKYNDQKWGGFGKKEPQEPSYPEMFKQLPKAAQKALKDYVWVEGGTFTAGLTDYSKDSINFSSARRVTLASFTLNRYEVTVSEYREFARDATSRGGNQVAGLNTVWYDTLIWVRDFPYSSNDPIARNYFWHPSFDQYPIVGITYHQALAYCDWKSKQINTQYLKGTDWEVQIRLPSALMWEYAALALVGNAPKKYDEFITDRKIYPWYGTYFSKPAKNERSSHKLLGKKEEKNAIAFNCNGGAIKDAQSLMIIGYDNDGYMYTAPVKSFIPNDLGLYQMAGNVAEWTTDNYEISEVQMEELIGALNTRLTLEDVLNMDLMPKFPYDKYDGYKVVKGGSFYDRSYYMQCGTFQIEHPDTARATIGFRTVAWLKKKGQ